MLLPTKNMNTISLYNYYSKALGYRKHSALKIRVKPRQALASVNTKLIEQQQRPQTQIEHRAPENVEKYFIAENQENQEEKMRREETTLTILNKEGFRPSTVKKRNNKVAYTDTKMDTGVKSSNNYIDSKKLLRTKTDPISSHHRNLEPDVFITELNNPLDGINNKTQLTRSLSNLLVAKINKSDPNLDELSQSLLIKNLSDEEFLKILQEYRKSKLLNLEALNKSISKNSSSTTPIISPRTTTTTTTTSATSVINLESQFVQFSSSLNSNSNRSNRTSKARGGDTMNQKASNYYMNYLNNKILDRNSKIFVERFLSTAKKLNDANSKEQLLLDKQRQTKHNSAYVLERNKNNSSNNSNVDKLESMIKVSNFPTFAN